MKKAKSAVAVAACAVAAVMAMGALAGCSSQQAAEPEGDATGATEAAEEVSYEPLSVSYLNKASYEDIIVADNQGLFDAAGPEIALYTVSGSGQQSVEAMLAGSSDIAATGQGPVADAIKQYGDDIVVLAGTNCATGGQVWVAGANMTGDAQLTPYDSATDNKAEVKASFEAAAAALGHPVRAGVQQGASTESDFKSWLKAMDISFNDFGAEGDATVQLVNVQANMLPTTLSTGDDIDVMAASQPYPDTAVAQVAGAYEIGSNADTGAYTVSFAITTRDVYEAKEDSIKAYYRAIQQACDFMNGSEEEAVQIVADSIGSSVEDAQAAFDIADFNVALSDQMIDTLLSTCEKKGVEITRDELIAQMPLYDWITNGMTD